jgi:hypothetical protein
VIDDDWQEMGCAAAPGIADDWGIEPWEQPRAWFTIRRTP